MSERLPKVDAGLKNQIRDEQNGECACCGLYRGHALQIHHVLPRFIAIHDYGMPKWLYNARPNLVGLCGERSKRNGSNDCHDSADRGAFDRRITFYGETLDEAAAGLYNLAVMVMYIHYRYLVG